MHGQVNIKCIFEFFEIKTITISYISFLKIGCGVVFIIILICIIVPYAFISYYENTDGYNIASTSGWTFFLLLNAFYGGALTMFFTSEIRIPFTSIEDVMRQYPTWRLLMMNGNDVHFQYKALQVKINCFDIVESPHL